MKDLSLDELRGLQRGLRATAIASRRLKVKELVEAVRLSKAAIKVILTTEPWNLVLLYDNFVRYTRDKVLLSELVITLQDMIDDEE